MPDAAADAQQFLASDSNSFGQRRLAGLPWAVDRRGARRDADHETDSSPLWRDKPSRVGAASNTTLVDYPRRSWTGGDSALTGGAIFVEEGGELTVLDSVLEGTHSQRNGGAIGSDADDTVIRDSTIRANHSRGNGGGVFASYGLQILESTISGNTSGRDGGGVFADAPPWYLSNILACLTEKAFLRRSGARTSKQNALQVPSCYTGDLAILSQFSWQHPLLPMARARQPASKWARSLTRRQ